MEKWVNENKKLLLKIGNEYEQNERQTYHFMYDLVSLFKSIEDYSELKSLLDEIHSGLNLFHNRIQAEIYSAYKQIEIPITLSPTIVNSSKKPDLKIKDTISDVKTILLTNPKNREKTAEHSLFSPPISFL